MPACYCRPSFNVSQYAAWDTTVGTPDSLYPATNLGNLDPSNPVKSSGTLLTVRATFPQPQNILIAQFVMHNLAGRPIYIANSAGLNKTLTPGPNTRDGFPEFSWIDFRTSPLQTASWWTFAFDRASGIVQVGEIVLWSEVLDLPILWKVKHGPRRLVAQNVTDWGYQHYYDRGVRERTIDGDLIDGDYLDAMFELEADAHGCVRQWPMILEPEKKDSYWVRFEDEAFVVGRDAPRIAKMTFTVQETGLGLAPR